MNICECICERAGGVYDECEGEPGPVAERLTGGSVSGVRCRMGETKRTRNEESLASIMDTGIHGFTGGRSAGGRQEQLLNAAFGRWRLRFRAR